ncbi:MAG: SGNH/GDSL hydrolase family protein [Methylococcales bacterium]
MAKNAASGKVLLVLGSILFCLTVFLIGEFTTRYFSNITFFGNSKNLFLPKAFGLSLGNAKNIEAVSFGSKVFTDQYGFRIPEHQTSRSKASKQEALFILGDSVAFGPGLDEEKTFSGMLRAEFPDLEVYNSSVIGYSTRDYRNVINSFPLAAKGIDHVFLLFCLNDISNESAKEIKQFIDDSRNVNRSNGQLTHAQSFVDILKGFEFFGAMNEFLRSNSKLYLLLKGILTDPQARYWEADYRLYLEANHARFLSSMQELADIAATLRKDGIPFTVIIAPYEFQLRSPDEATLLPQRKLQDYFARHSIDYIDSTPWFIKQHTESRKFFLAYDPMHFSAQGHKLIYNIIVDRPGLFSR